MFEPVEQNETKEKRRARRKAQMEEILLREKTMEKEMSRNSLCGINEKVLRRLISLADSAVYTDEQLGKTVRQYLRQ